MLYDSLLGLDLPAGLQLVTFADDVAVVGIARTEKLADDLLNPVLEEVALWMRENGRNWLPRNQRQ